MTEKKELDIKKQINGLVVKGQKALSEFMGLTQEEVDFIVKKASVAGIDKHGVLAEHAVNETGRGIFEDKAIKNMFACEYVPNNMKNLKTVGVVSKDDIRGITEIAEPVGVICGIVPTTNPTSTAMFKSLIALKTRNPIIFSFHPSANGCSIAAAKVIRDAAIAAGAPENCIQWIEVPSMEGTSQLMNHPGVATILATGGNAMVRAAYSCGKPALGVGAGNVPAYIEKTAKIERAVYDIVLSKSFDNGMICASEQAVIIDTEIYDDAITRFKKFHVYFTTKEEKKKLEKFMFGVVSGTKDVENGKLNPNVVGKSPQWIAKEAGFTVPEDIVIIASECVEVGVKEPLTREKLSPVLAVLRSKNTEDGMIKAEQMVEFNGLGHSAAIHSQDDDLIEEFGKRVKACRIIANAPSTFGGIGDVYNAFLPSLTLGCGSYGANSVSNNVGAINLLNIKRIGRRNNNMQWFKVPSKIYFEPNSIQYLAEIKDLKRVTIVTDKMIEKLGYVQRILNVLYSNGNMPAIDIISDIKPDPDVDMVYAGLERIKAFEPDTIIALGGGSPMDAAKVMWLLYENPEVEFDDLKQKFIDIRKRAFKYPSLGEKAKMICIPTTSGTGSEVTPFAVITDKKAKKKYPLADYALTPTIAIIDSELVMNVPSFVTADTGLDVLTHATEAYVSILASDYTDGLALQAIKIVFEYLERSVHQGAADPEARTKMHNASTMAGMAFANAFLGINHSLAHKIGGMFGTVHGRTNAILLPHVIRYNGTIPGKFAVWPKYESYIADKRYQDIAKLLGLPASTPAEGVESFAKAVTELAQRCGVEMSLQSLGVDEKEFKENIHTLAMNAYEDQCSPCNPRLPMIKDMEEILENAYYGKKL
ncbi:acetaldehyde dehydrogenase [Erysipelotrichaceae bacterium]|nr:acetaldehyde dehydrogenase [Erysipelotrichaceae bacterium]